MRFTSEEIAKITGGDHGGPPAAILRAVIDSRIARQGDIFIPVRGDRDGHDYIPAALDAGVAAYLTEYEPVGGTAIRVGDTLRALHDLGRAARNRVPDLVVAVTGSVGKTTVKELCLGAFRHLGAVEASPASYNNELGVPLTLINATAPIDALIVEMGARGQGHIRQLCAIARPKVGIVTAVDAAHLEQFVTLEEVARAKGELVEALPASGLAVLNGDDPLVAPMAGITEARTVTFGLSSSADVHAGDIRMDSDLRARFRLSSPWGSADICLAVNGRHQVANALAAATPALWAGLVPTQVADGLARVTAPDGRMVIRHAPSGAVIIDDTYNANPASVRAAFQSLAALRVERRIAVLGLMAELGDMSQSAHRAIAADAEQLGIELISVDTDLYGISPTPIGDVADRIGPLDDRCAVLVKGSRVAALERVLPLLQ